MHGCVSSNEGFRSSVLTIRRTAKYLNGCNFSSWHCLLVYTRGEVESPVSRRGVSDIVRSTKTKFSSVHLKWKRPL